MKQIEVVAAIIRKKDKIFATQRGYGKWKDWWEFPGGKMEVELEQLEDCEVAEDVEEIFEEDSGFSNDDEALAAMEFYDSPDAME